MDIKGIDHKSCNELKSDFQGMLRKHKISIFFNINELVDEKEISDFVTECKKTGVGRIIPRFKRAASGKTSVGAMQSAETLRVYTILLNSARKNGIKLALDEACFYTGNEADTDHECGGLDDGLRCRVLETREYACTEGESLNLMIHPGVLMSLVAIEEESGEIVDLRDKITRGFVIWDVPCGNWTVIQYLCSEDFESCNINYLSYDVSYKYLESVYGSVTQRFSGDMGNVIDCLFYHDVQFATRNRRMWDEGFNAAFESEYGFDPAPYYPALFRNIGDKTPHYKALFFNCRAKQLQNGFLKAVSDFCEKNSIFCIGTAAGSKFPACSWLHGDGIMASRYATAPCAQMCGSYLYGSNSLKIASGAADCLDREIVACEMFGGYPSANSELLYKEMIFSYSKGVNHVFAYTPEVTEPCKLRGSVACAFAGGSPGKARKLFESVARMQSLLFGGRHVCDIAVLYPIYSLHSHVYLYEDRGAEGFEYPNTPENADYMNVINAITGFVGLDLTVLHPEVLHACCRTEGGVLFLDNDINSGEYRIIILPACDVISVESIRMLKRYFDGGGKVIATGKLPIYSFEFVKNQNYDDEVRETVIHIFGDGCLDSGSIKKYCHNQNEAGGEAYFLYSSMSALDGTFTVSSSFLDEVLKSYNIAYDVEIENFPRHDVTGLLNIPLSEYVHMGMHHSIKGSGSLSYIHKCRNNCEIYYFANSSNVKYEGNAFLKGRLESELWNPQSGKIKKASCEHVQRKGVTYTRMTLDIPPATSLFAVGRKY